MRESNRNLGLVAAVALFSSQAGALPVVTVADDYIGSDDHDYGDVIGDANVFGIEKATFNQRGNMLLVEIFTAFAGQTHGDGTGPFPGYTKNDRGIGYGDLFLAPAWAPEGGAPYTNDNHLTGTVWTHGFALDDNWSASGGGSGALYALSGTNDQSAVLAEDLFNSGVVFRNGQEVLVDKTGGHASGTSNTGSWGAANGVVEFSIDITGTGLDLYGEGIAFHWGVTCANDTIEGFAEDDSPDNRVPEPGTLALLALGLMGAAAARRRTRT